MRRPFVTREKALEMLVEQMQFIENFEFHVEEAAGAINVRIERAISEGRLSGRPEFFIELGSGFDKWSEGAVLAESVDYAAIPHFLPTGTDGHNNRLSLADIEGVPVLLLEGRKHFYELAERLDRYKRVAFSTYVMGALKIPNALFTNAGGALNPEYKKHDLVILTTHDGLNPDPLCGRIPQIPSVKGQPVDMFPGMLFAYDSKFADVLQAQGDPSWLHKGSYFSVIGRSYETEGRSRDLTNRGYDIAGMSLTNVHPAVNLGMRVAAISHITNEIHGNVQAASHGEVTAAGNSPLFRARFNQVLTGFLAAYARGEAR